MRYVTVLGLLVVLSLSAFGQVPLDPNLPDPNVGFCPVPATATACQGQPDTNPISSSTSFGMWIFGNNDASGTLFLLLAIPEPPTASTPTITSSSGLTVKFGGDAGDYLSTTSGSIYDFANASGLTGGNSNNSINTSNLFPSIVPGVGTPSDYEILVYDVTGTIHGSTAYAFSSSSALPNGTIIAGLGVDTHGAQISTPFTTAGAIDSTPSVPDGGMTLMLLGGALVGLESLRRRFRA